MNIDALTQAMFQAGRAPARKTAGSAGTAFLEEVAKGLAPSEEREAQAVEEIVTLSLEDRLKVRYPGLVYHVFDGSSRYWRCRQDYPFHKIYQPDADPSEIENWRPSGPNPDPLDPQVQRNLGSIPPGSKAVIIHPKVQQRMEEDPDYAQVIYDRIEAWFTFDQVRNEAIIPGCTLGMSQCIAIGEDGEIANVQACSGGGLTRSRSGEDDEDDFWTARAKRHHEYMQQVIEAQILHAQGIALGLASLRRVRAKAGTAVSTGTGGAAQLTAIQSSQQAIAQTMAMINGPELRAALGDTVAGTSIDDVFQSTISAIAQFHPTIV